MVFPVLLDLYYTVVCFMVVYFMGVVQLYLWFMEVITLQAITLGFLEVFLFANLSFLLTF